MKLSVGVAVLLAMAVAEVCVQCGALGGDAGSSGWHHVVVRSFSAYTVRTSMVDSAAVAVARAAAVALLSCSYRAVFGGPVLGMLNFACVVWSGVKAGLVLSSPSAHYVASEQVTHAMAYAGVAFALADVMLYFVVRAETKDAYARYAAARGAVASGYANINNDDGHINNDGSGVDGPGKGSLPGRSGKEPRSANLGRLFGLAKPHSAILAVALLALLVAAMASLAIPLYFGRIIEAVTASGHSSKSDGEAKLNRSVVQLIVVFAVGSCATFVRGWLFTLAGQRVVAALRVDLFRAVMAQEIGFFDQTRTGELLNRLSSDTQVVQNAVTVNISMFARSTVTVVGGIAILFIVSWRLTLVMLSVVPVISVAAVVYGRMLRKLRKRFQSALADAGTSAEESISAVRTVRSFSNEGAEINRYMHDVGVSYDIGARIALAYGSFAGGVSLAAELGIVCVLYYGGRLVLDGDMTAGSLTSFLLYTLTVGINLASLASLFGSVMQALGASERIFALLDREPQLNPPTAGQGAVIAEMRGHIEVHDVLFEYPSRPDASVLRGVTFDMEPGSVTAIVGPSGAGKSTLFSLLERFYDPTGGVITIDGVDLRDLDLGWLRSRMALVAQEPTLFACSILDNIAYAKPSATLDEIMDAARKANAHDFIMSFPEQYETMVGERGVRLSGGQKQRIAIARAILTDPVVLLCDEATSALDAESESLVQEAIDTLMVGRAAVCVIAHRLSTVRSASKVVVIDEGVVAESGTHDELLALDGLYKRLVERQLLRGE